MTYFAGEIPNQNKRLEVLKEKLKILLQTKNYDRARKVQNKIKQIENIENDQ